MDSASFPESPLEQDDIAYPCKGCGEVCHTPLGCLSAMPPPDAGRHTDTATFRYSKKGKPSNLVRSSMMGVTLRDRYTDSLPAGNRWHIDCFRCNTCGTILDSDANLLLLGDGSLICNNCTYSCSVCGNKIEDLAILTGDQAFCATCFKCRNCKKKIENLKYARTSQGIFCMECHESLMQRRRKKSQRNGSTRQKHLQQPQNNTMLLDKSLPSLPPSAVSQSAFSPDNESPPSETYSETPTELPQSSQQRPGNSRSRSEAGGPGEGPRGPPKRPPNIRSHSSRSDKRERSPLPHEEERRGTARASPGLEDQMLMCPENLTLPSTSYHNNRNSTQSQRSVESANGEGFFIPMALDPNPAPGPSPLSRREVNSQWETSNAQQGDGKPNARDYFNAINAASRKAPIEQEKENVVTQLDSPADSRHSSVPTSPHISQQYQDRGRQTSADFTDPTRRKKDIGNKSINAVASDASWDTPANDARNRRNGETQDGKFMLQEAPRKKRISRTDPMSPSVDTSIPQSDSAPVSANARMNEQHVTMPHESPVSSRSEAMLSGSPRDTQRSLSQTSESPSSHSSSLTTQLKTLPERGDSLVRGKQPVSRKEVDSGALSKLSNVSTSESHFEKPASAPPTTTNVPSLAGVASKQSTPRAQDSPSLSKFPDGPPPPLRARERLAHQDGSSSDTFVTPRVPPNPPNTAHKPNKESTSTIKSDSTRNGESLSPNMARHPHAAEFTMDEENSRPGAGDSPQEQGGFLRRVSHSVRHARSYSDRGTRMSKEQKWPKSPLIPSGSHSPAFPHEISSPMTTSPENKEELEWFKNELRKERQKSYEKGQRLQELEAALESKNSIKQMNTELREKRSTMVVLDTQKEIVVRELEVLTEHISAAKKSGEPLDLGKLSNTVLREFAESLQKLKDSFSPQIEDLTQRRNEILEEVDRITQNKDKSFQEFEQLSLKNAQLAELNNQLVHQIQELYKANTGPPLDIARPPPNGLGIYTQNHKERPNASIDSREPRPSLAESSMTGSTVVQEHDVEPATYLTAPQVVNIRKAQPKKFNWKKGGHNVAKGVSKGLKAAFNDGNRSQREGQYPEGMSYGQMQQQEYPSSNLPRNQGQDRRDGFGGLFGNQKQRPQQWKNSPNGSMPAVNSDGGPGNDFVLRFQLCCADVCLSFVRLRT